MRCRRTVHLIATTRPQRNHVPTLSAPPVQCAFRGGFGASEREDSVAGILFKNLRNADYSGQVYPVNPKHEMVFGERCYASAGQLPETPELALIATPAATVAQVMAECGQRGIRHAIVLSAGFREVGAEGAALEDALVNVARKYGIRLIGPNCLGISGPPSASMPPSARAPPMAAIWRWFRNPARFAPPFWTGRRPTTLAFPAWFPPGSRPTWISARSLITWFRQQDPEHPALHRRHPRCAQFHELAARRRPHQAGDPGQGGPPCGRLKGGACRTPARWSAPTPYSTRWCAAPAWCG